MFPATERPFKIVDGADIDQRAKVEEFTKSSLFVNRTLAYRPTQSSPHQFQSAHQFGVETPESAKSGSSINGLNSFSSSTDSSEIDPPSEWTFFESRVLHHPDDDLDKSKLMNSATAGSNVRHPFLGLNISASNSLPKPSSALTNHRRSLSPSVQSSK